MIASIPSTLAPGRYIVKWQVTGDESPAFVAVRAVLSICTIGLIATAVLVATPMPGE